ncbi:MAG: hypothetical protein AB9834_08390 [Lentimicrobium sp.]
MKTGFLSLMIATLLLAGPVSAQQPPANQEDQFSTFFGNQSNAVGGYISFGLGNTMINGNNAVLGQFRLAARLGHSFSVGIAGAGFSDWLYGLNHDRPGLSPDGYFIEGGYGGLLLEPVFAPQFPVHLSFPVIIGAGGVAFTGDSEGNDWNDWDYDSHRVVLASNAYFVVEPGVELEFNLARFIRMGAGVSYRFTSAFKMEGESEHLLNGLSCSVNLKLGAF